MWLKFSILVFFGVLLWPHFQVAAQLEVLGMLNMSLTASDPNIDYTKPDIMGSNLASLATLIDNVTKAYAPRANMSSGPYSLPESNLVKGLAYWLALLNPLGPEIVTITNNTRYGVNTTFPAVSILEGLPVVFGIQNSTNVTLTPVTYAPGTSATSPAVFGAELNNTVQILTELVGNNLYRLMIYQMGFYNSYTFQYGYFATAWTAPALNQILPQILPLIIQTMTDSNPATVLSTLEKLSIDFKLILNLIPGNTSLIPPDPIQTYTCGAVFTENLDRFFVLLTKTTIAGSNLINSNSTAIKILSDVTQTVGEFNSVLPYLTNLTEQVTGMLLNETVMMSGWSQRRVYPHQVRTNLDRADCHKLYLKRYNARRFG